MAKYSEGTIVKYNPNWCTEAEKDLTFVVIEVRDHSDDKDFGKVQYLIQSTKPFSSGIFYHTEQVDEEMIESVSTQDEEDNAKGYTIIEIPADKRRENESNEDTFCRIAETWTGEHLIDFGDYTDEKLGRWIKENMNRAIDDIIPCLWIEDENGNMIESFVFYKEETGNLVRHQIIEV